ncbi:MAG: cyclic nucleotide-binding domain-containing protein, partial [Candidatus Omnitrophica bacterium]|nr:cyclic nucleotide-binding domain-containing protein [Candidatus Omnitrophota bacterium]
MGSLSTHFQRLHILKQIPIFNKLGWLELQRIAAKASLVEFKKGTVIRKQGDPPDAFYCLISGRVQAYNATSQGKKNNVEFIHRGMYFGIISLLTGENHSLTFETINDSTVLKIDKDDFQGLLKIIPHLGIALSQSLSRRLRSTTLLPTKSIFESTIISIYSPVKGSGSSTYAANLAYHLQRETQKRVVLVRISSILEDIELVQGLQATPQWKRKGYNLIDIVEDHEKILGCVCRGELDFDLLNVRFSPQDASLINEISRFVTSLVNDYHYVVVDLPNEMDQVVLKTLTQSDLIHLMTFNREEDLKMIRVVIDRLEEELKENFHQEKIHIILSGKEEDLNLSFEEVKNLIDFEVYTKVPHIDSDQLTLSLDSSEMSVMVPNSQSHYYREVRRISREIGGVLVGLVLGGGAALGVAHVGVIRVLEQENIPIDIVVGSSMGALLGAFWAIGKDAAELEKLAREFENPKAMWKLVDPIIPIPGFVGGRLIKHWLKTRGLDKKTFYTTRVPLRIVAYDLAKRQELVISSGSLVDAVRKSVSIPGVISPVLEDGGMIIDGGVLNPLPTNVLTTLGIKKIIAVNVLQSPDHVNKGYLLEQEELRQKSKISFWKSPAGYVRFRTRRFFTNLFTPNISDIIVRTLQASEYIIAEQSAHYADVLIYPDL